MINYQHSKSLDQFMARCRQNLNNTAINTFLDLRVTRKNEHRFQTKLAKAGCAEFSGPQESWPSLFLSVTDWENTPYHKAINLERVHTDHFSYSKEWMAGNQLFNYDCVQKDPDRELNDWLRLRAMDRDFQAIMLFQDNKDWMIDSPSELITNQRPADHAHGHVITFGLGIGYYLFLVLNNPAVSEITVIEKNKDVLDLFEHYLWPQFPHVKPVHFINQDAFTCWNDQYLNQFDSIYMDIWQSSEDGLQCINKALSQCNPEQTCDFWIEDSCEEVLWSLIFQYFEADYFTKKANIPPEYKKYYRKVEKYFDHIDLTVTNPDQIKYFMYDKETIRQILAQ